ncbi:MAG: sulfite exporter TauE/SafE family protein [Chitinophagales bacterium]|jgi:uncharacterized membrane protein YfcA|nr:sulfite exporter TauE/SafE family protein [Chitinophagales bacterium]
MEIIGYLCSMLIGLSLGLIGSGGSILTVPVLVYLFGVSAVTATAYSLFIVGLTSAIGSINYFRNGLVNLRIALVFGLPSIVAVFMTRAYLVPAIPDTLFSLNGLVITKGILLLVLFALLMIAASYSMIKPSKTNTNSSTSALATDTANLNYPMIIAEGLIVGTLTGLVGAGGGFLIIPALVLLSKLDMKQAVGTSLVIIALKSLIGFLGESNETGVNWGLLLSVSVFAIVGIFVGATLAKRVDGNKLKPAFGWFVLVMGIYIIVKELFFHH